MHLFMLSDFFVGSTPLRVEHEWLFRVENMSAMTQSLTFNVPSFLPCWCTSYVALRAAAVSPAAPQASSTFFPRGIESS